MEQKFLLERNRSEFSNDVERNINLNLSTKTRLLPNDNISDNFSLFEQYNKERDECNKFRLILNINPICSNVLFNARTEIVLNEGSPNCTLLIGKKTLSKNKYAPNAINTKKNISYLDAIRNTEYSHKENGQFVYHCGFDIFNNHLLRKKDFIHVNQIKEGDTNLYNTIFDYSRDNRGKIIKEDIRIEAGRNEKIKMHLYQYDTIMSMPVAFKDNCIEKNGWWGFTNPGTIEISNSVKKDISINRMMANNKSCEFIDLYPDRSLFSFVPKFNNFRKRLEKNWDYCLTYPYKSDYDLINTVCGGQYQSIRANIEYHINGAGLPIIECSSYFKHNLKVGDFVSFYYYLPHYKIIKKYIEGDLKYHKEGEKEYLYLEDDFNIKGDLKEENNGPIREILSKEFVRYNIKVKVNGVGDANGEHTDRIFNVKYSDIKEIYENMKYMGCFYKKNVSNSDCLYYFRKFKKLKTINGDNIKSDINKIAFGENIYGDDVAQIIFTDDIDIKNLLDNNGRPISEIYFTVVKRNAGYKEWYEKQNYTGETIEASHCFGEVTSAIDFCGIKDEPFDYNIHMAHNMYKSTNLTKAQSNTFSAWGETVLSGRPKTIESEITIDNDEFYGDIVEYDITKSQETVIGNIYHRFNTAQRETWNLNYKDILHDEIVYDDYDTINGEGKPFKIETYYLNNYKNPLSTNGNSENLIYGNIFPEGYFYNPHTKIQLKENKSIETTSPAKYINHSSLSLNERKVFLHIKQDESIEIYHDEIKAYAAQKQEGGEIILQNAYYEIKIKSPTNYGFYKGDNIAFYDKKTSEIIWGEIINTSGTYLTIKVDKDDFKIIGDITLDLFDKQSSKHRLYIYWSPNNTPIFAKLCEGTRKFVWREIVPPSKMIKTDDLYNLPFTNGRFYVESNINFFLKRQDPTGQYGLSSPMFKVYKQNVANPMGKYNINGYKPIDFSEIMYIMNNLYNNCF